MANRGWNLWTMMTITTALVTLTAVVTGLLVARCTGAGQVTRAAPLDADAAPQREREGR